LEGLSLTDGKTNEFGKGNDMGVLVFGNFKKSLSTPSSTSTSSTSTSSNPLIDVTLFTSFTLFTSSFVTSLESVSPVTLL
jgi:hypothetical protein